MTAIRFGSELTFIGTTSAVAVRSLPLYTVPWVNEGPATVEILRNGRPRAKCCTPGHNRGVKPPNTGLSFPPRRPPEHSKRLAVRQRLFVGRRRGSRTPTGIRNHALLTLLWRTGLRISEALDLRPHHVDFAAKRVTVLHGKGDKRRTVGIDDGALMAVQAWLLERHMLNVKPTDPLFCTVQNPGKGNRMHPAYVRARLHDYGRAAGVPKRVHPHGFRHTLACDLVREGFSLPNVQAQLGHSNVATTATYLRGLGADEAFERVAGRVMPGGVL